MNSAHKCVLLFSKNDDRKYNTIRIIITSHIFFDSSKSLVNLSMFDQRSLNALIHQNVAYCVVHIENISAKCFNWKCLMKCRPIYDKIITKISSTWNPDLCVQINMNLIFVILYGLLKEII